MKRWDHFVWFLIVSMVFLANPVAFAQTDFWQQTNGPYGGIVNALVVGAAADVFAGGFGGGVFRSSDNGGSWIEVNTGVTDKFINCLVLDSSGHLYAGSNWFVYRSVDNGETWVPVLRYLSGVYTLAISPAGHIFVGTGFDGAIFRSTDNGATWAQLNAGLTNTFVYALAIDSSGHIFAGTNGGGVFRSTDNGQTWVQLDSGLTGMVVYALAINSRGHLFAGTEGGGVFRSTDNGDSWVTSQTPPIEALSITPTDVIYAGSRGSGVWRSTDSGATWTLSSAGLSVAFVRSLSIKPGGFIFAGTGGAGVFLSTNNGDSWVPTNYGLKTLHVNSVGINSADILLAGTTNGGVFRSTDRGGSWSNVGLWNLQITAFATDLSGNVIAASDGGVYRSADGGLNWSRFYTGLPDGYVFEVAATPSGSLFAGFAEGGVYRSTDQGVTWTQAGLSNLSVYELDSDTRGSIYAATNSGVYRSTDNGTSWTQAGLSNARVYSLAVHRDDRLFAGTSDGGVYTSTDRGSAWLQVVSGLPSVNHIAINRSGFVFVCTINGVYRSTNNGVSWTQLNTGLSNTWVQDLAFDSRGYAFGGSLAGVFRSAGSTLAPHIILSEASAAFLADSSTSLTPSQTVLISNGGGGVLTWSLTKQQVWFSVDPASGEIGEGGSSTVTMSVTTTDLIPGTYQDTIVVSSTNADNSPQKIPVTYVVSPRARMSVNVQSLTFAADSNNAIPPEQSVTVTNTGAGTLRWQVRKSKPWLSVNPDTGTGNSAEIAVAILTTDLVPGTHVDTLEITGVKLETGSSALNSPQRIVVTFAVGAQARIGLDRAVISFLGDSAAAIPPTQSFTISNAGGGTLQWRVTKRQAWLGIGPTEGTSNSATITVGVLTTDLAPGTYEDTIEVTGSRLETGRTAVNSPQLIAVAYAVGGRARLALDKTVFAFATDSGAVTPGGQTLAITNTAAGTLRWVVTKSAPWLSVSPDTGTGNSATVTVAIVQTDLRPGTYEDTVRVTATKAETGSSALDSPQGVVVTFTVEPRAKLLVSKATISFTADSGAVLPPAELFTISNIGGGTLRWSVAKTQPWLSISPDAAITNSDTITLSILTTDLAAGTYRDTLRVAGEKVETGTSAVNSPQPIEVTYRVFALPRIVLDRREIEFVADSAAVLPQPEQFVLTNGGDYTLDWTITKREPWLSVDPTSGVSNRDTIGLQVITTNLAPGTYLDTVRITSTNAINSPQYLVVTYRVIENHAPAPFALISPAEGDTLQLLYRAAPVLFRWHASTDPDAGDVIRYSAFLTGTGFDTTLSQLNDTTVVLDIMERLTMRTAYRWWVEATDGVLTTLSDTAQFVTSSTVTDVDLQTGYIPKSYALYQNYPNPFNPSTTIRFDLPKQSHVNLKIYNLLGEEVVTLANEEKPAGRYEVTWDVSGFGSGVYFYKLEVDGFTQTRKLLLLR